MLLMGRPLEPCLLKLILTNLVQAERPHILDEEHRYTVGLQMLKPEHGRADRAGGGGGRCEAKVW